MKEFVEQMVRRVVDYPSKVRVEQISISENTIEIVVEVDREDIGKVIGKKGKNINAMRTLVTAMGAKVNNRVSLQVVE